MIKVDAAALELTHEYRSYWYIGTKVRHLIASYRIFGELSRDVRDYEPRRYFPTSKWLARR